MITLKELIKQREQSWDKIDDLQLIKKFFTINGMEVEGIDLLHELTKSKLEKMQRKDEMVQTWTSYLPSKYLYETYDLETADMLHALELDYISHGKALSQSRLDWAEENLPNIKEPKAYFQPLVKYLGEKGIFFAERNLQKDDAPER